MPIERVLHRGIYVNRNVSHTIGSFSLGFLAIAGVSLFVLFAPTFGMDASQAWRGNFIFPAVVAIVIAIFCWWAIRDTPESCGLPSVQEYRKVGAQSPIP